MALADFDPSKVVILDWYKVLFHFFPEVDITDEYDCNRKFAEIFETVRIEISFNRSPFWLRLYLKNGLKRTEKELKVFLKQNPQYDFSYFENFALSWLLPSGVILNNVKHDGVCSRFTFEDKDYAYTNDGSLISLEPVLDKRFLPKYLKKDKVVDIDHYIKDLEYLEI